MDELVQALWIVGLSKSGLFRICAELGQHMEHFRNRSLRVSTPTCGWTPSGVKVRQDGRVMNMAAVIAVGVRETGSGRC